MAKGGARIGAGRKTKANEEKVRGLAIKSIVELHGSEEAGFKWLLQSNEPSLIKFVYEHGYGKPTENLNHTGDLAIRWNESKNYEPYEKTDGSD